MLGVVLFVFLQNAGHGSSTPYSDGEVRGATSGRHESVLVVQASFHD